jgi:hypothetical protein
MNFFQHRNFAEDNPAAVPDEPEPDKATIWEPSLSNTKIALACSH